MESIIDFFKCFGDEVVYIVGGANHITFVVREEAGTYFAKVNIADGRTDRLIRSMDNLKKWVSSRQDINDEEGIQYTFIISTKC